MIHRTIRRRRTQGQGMTEYIVIVGLIAILLVVAVLNFKNQIKVTIEGSDGNGGAVGAVNDIGDDIAADDGGGGNGGVRGGGGTTTNGYELSSDGSQANVNGSWVPYNPSVHGDRQP